MSLMLRRPSSSDELLPIAGALNQFVNRFDLTPDRNMIVHCFGTDIDDWDRLPAAWHRPTHADIVLNVGKLMQSMRQRGQLTTSIHETRDGRYWMDEHLIRSAADGIRAYLPGDETPRRFETFTEDGLAFSGRTVVNTHPQLRNALRPQSDRATTGGHKVLESLLALILHETGHAVFSQYITEDWYGELTGYERQIMTMFEELRCERQQLARIGGSGAALIRKAVDVVIDPKRIIADLETRTEDGKLNIANLALNSTLCLGRTRYDVFLDREVIDLRNLVVASVNPGRYADMVRIWDEFSSIRDLDPETMIELVQEWAELFPSEDDGSGVRSSIAPPVPPSGESSEQSPDTGDPTPSSNGEDENTPELPGIAQDIADEIEKAAQRAAEHPEDTNHDYGPDDRRPSAESLRQAEKHTRSSHEHVRTLTPSAQDRHTAKQLAQELRQLNVADRGRTEVNSQTPPGRLRSRAMVQRAAERSQGRASAAEPWRRIKRTVHLNPPLFVGIMTDTSSSQQWSTEFSSRAAWILARAVAEINGRVAAVTFGENVRILHRPNERIEQRTEVEARDYTEMFDVGIGALDAMLQLTRPGGTRIVFVITDGQFIEGMGSEMRKAAEWVELLTRAGVLVVWMTRAPGFELYEYPTTPPGSLEVHVDPDYAAEHPHEVIGRIAGIVKTEVARRKRQ